MINKLVNKIVKTNAPVVVGLDPMMKFIPEHVQACLLYTSPSPRD